MRSSEDQDSEGPEKLALETTIYLRVPHTPRLVLPITAGSYVIDREPDTVEDSGGTRPTLDQAMQTWSQMNDATLLRGAAAVLVGFAILTIGSVAIGRSILALTNMSPSDPPTSSFLVMSLSSRLLLAVLAGYLTGKAAPRAPLLHAAALACLLAFFSLAAIGGLTAAGGLQDPSWYPTAMLFIGPVGVLAGGALRIQRY